MSEEKFISEKHVKQRAFFRQLGPIVLGAGLVCLVISMIEFFTLPPFAEPSLFWLGFVAMPIIFVGAVMSSLGYSGAVAKYQSREYAPVAKDTLNYIAKETKPGVADISRAMEEGRALKKLVSCPNCQHHNNSVAKFCNECGFVLQKECPSCHQVNVAEARFCNDCGGRL